MLLAFFLVANVSFIGIESLTTGRLAILALMLWAAATWRNPFPLMDSPAWLMFLPGLYVAVQFAMVGDWNQLSRFVNLAIYAYVGSALFVAVARSPRHALIALHAAFTLHALLIFYSFVSLDYRAWFDASISIGANYDAFYLYRAPGFSGDAGASLSVTQAMGTLVGWALLRSPAWRPVSRAGDLWIGIGALLCAASCALVGRTGLLLSALFFGLILLHSRVRAPLALITVAGLTAVLGAASQLLTSTLGDDFSVEFLSDWILGAFRSDDQTVREIAEMPIPSLNVETFFGTGLSSVVGDVNPSGHDSGFIQAYYSMGLPITVLFYSLYLFVLYRCLFWLPLALRLLVTLTLFALEAKEPFVFKHWMLFSVLTLYLCHRLRFDELVRARASHREASP